MPSNNLSKEVSQYVDQAYAGFIGMVAGVIYGSPLESDYYNTTSIKKYFDLEKRDVFSYSKYAADDDINGPFIFAKSYFDSENNVPTTIEVGKAWLANVRYERGTFWWGPSTERKAFENLKSGISAEKSGTTKCNGEFLSNQIGGQIFIDSWGIIFGGDVVRAVKAAENAAKVSHDENGVEGGKFVAACISLAFTEKNCEDIVAIAINFLDDHFEFKKMATELLELYRAGGNLAAAYEMIGKYGAGRNFGHVIPNAAIIIYSLLWGENNFSKSINLAIQAAWDTDCNASNVGTILGVLNGIGDLPKDVVDLINDEVILSGAVASENILSISSFIKRIVKKRFDLEIETKFFHKYATYGITLSNKARSKLVIDDQKLIILVNGLNRNQSVDVFKKNVYLKDDLQDTRYQPVFSPKVEPGDVLKFDVDVELDNIEILIYLKSLGNQIKTYLNKKVVGNTISVVIPEVNGNLITEIGFEIKNIGREFQQVWGEIAVTDIQLQKQPNYSFSFRRELAEMDTVLPYSCDGGNIYVADKFYEHDMNTQVMRFYTFEQLLALTGTTTKYDQGELTYDLIFQNGEAELVFHGKDLKNYYLFGFSNGLLTVSEIVDGSRKILFQITRQIVYNELQSFQVVFNQDETIFSLNNEQIVTLTCKAKGGLHGIHMAKPGDGEIVKYELKLGGSHEEGISIW